MIGAPFSYRVDGTQRLRRRTMESKQNVVGASAPRLKVEELKMTECRKASPLRRKTMVLALGATILAPLPAFAQVGGYPIDPAAERSASYDPSTARNADQTAARAADTQTSIASPGIGDRYEPDEIQDRRSDARQGERETIDASRTENMQDDRLLRRVRPPARLSEFEVLVSKVVDKPLRRFGANLLVPEARDFTAPPTTTVPPDYRINPGDELLIGLTGSVEASNLQLTVDSDGRIFIPRVGAVNVAGVRYGDLQSLIARQVSRQYRNFRVAVSIGQLRGITVYVTGYAAQPGSYTISSLSTLVNAVLAAGGPSAGGSFRSIQVRRDGQLVSDFDLYDLLLKGDKSADVLLQNGDVIYIAPAGSQVAVVGSVNVEAIYEARAGETTYDVLLYSGGINTVADSSRVLILDPTKPGGWKEFSPDQIQARVASRAEIVRVLPAIGIAQPLLSQPALVTLSGEVARPGRYYVQPGTPLSAVIEQAGGLTTQAFPYGSVLTRDSVRETQRQSYGRAVRDLELLLTTQPLTSVSQAEQLQPVRLAAVQSIVTQLKQREPDGRLVMEVGPSDRALPGELIVENNDTIYIPPQPVTVGVFGAVPSPASFQYRQNETIGDYLRRAGGVQRLGDKSEIFVVRANGTLVGQGRGLFGGSVLSQKAYPGDLIFVPVDAMRGEFWAKVRDISSALGPAAVLGAAVAQ